MHHIPEPLQVWAAHERSISSSGGSHTLSVPECIVHYQCSAVGRPCLAALEARCTITVNTWLLCYKEKKLCIRLCFHANCADRQITMASNLFWRNNGKQSWIETSEWFIGQMPLNFSVSYFLTPKELKDGVQADWWWALPVLWLTQPFAFQLRELNFHLCDRSSLACWRLNEFFILSSYKLQVDSPWTLFCCLLASHSPLRPLIFYSNLNSRSANIEGFAWSSLWTLFSLKCLDLQWHEKSAGDADGNLSCPLNTASPRSCNITRCREFTAVYSSKTSCVIYLV